MTFEILGGGQVTAPTDYQLVEALRQDGMAWAPTVSIEDFMEGMAERARMQKGVEVRTDAVHRFLFDLQLHGFLKPVDDPWSMIVADEIKRPLETLSPAGWHHRLIWSIILPYIVSTRSDGSSVHRPIYLDELSKPGYQQAWVRTHFNSLRAMP
jgi:hypothetical protein